MINKEASLGFILRRTHVHDAAQYNCIQLLSVSVSTPEIVVCRNNVRAAAFILKVE